MLQNMQYFWNVFMCSNFGFVFSNRQFTVNVCLDRRRFSSTTLFKMKVTICLGFLVPKIWQSISQDNFINHKPLSSEDCSAYLFDPFWNEHSLNILYKGNHHHSIHDLMA